MDSVNGNTEPESRNPEAGNRILDFENDRNRNNSLQQCPIYKYCCRFLLLFFFFSFFLSASPTSSKCKTKNMTSFKQRLPIHLTPLFKRWIRCHRVKLPILCWTSPRRERSSCPDLMRSAIAKRLFSQHLYQSYVCVQCISGNLQGSLTICGHFSQGGGVDKSK